MPAEKLKEFLDGRGVKYVAIKHSAAYTAQEIAASAHVRGKEMAKTVIVKVDDKLAMAVLPAALMVDVDRLKEGIGAASPALQQSRRAPRGAGISRTRSGRAPGVEGSASPRRQKQRLPLPRGLVSQIPSAYSRTIRSQEKRPICATLTMHLGIHSAGSR